jgi:hypothetical protein
MALLPYQLGSVSPAVLLHLLSGVLLGVVATDKAPSRGTEHSVPASDKVPGGAANHRALDATLRICDWRGESQREHDSRDRDELVHFVLLDYPIGKQRRTGEILPKENCCLCRSRDSGGGLGS